MYFYLRRLLPLPVKARITLELGYYTSLPNQVKSLVHSFGLYMSALAIIGLFINAYLWREFDGLTPLLLFNVGQFLGLPIGYYVNGYGLGKTHIKYLYFAGALLSGLIPLVVVLRSFSYVPILMIFGSILGFGSGLYWANKNILSLKLTKGINRIYYTSIEQILMIVAGVIMPILAGNIIVAGQYFNLYSLQTGYVLVFLLAFALIIKSGLVMLKSDIGDVTAQKITVPFTAGTWNYNRLYYLLYDALFGGMLFIPSILVLEYMGDESLLGNVNAVGSALAMLVVYIIARKVRLSQVWNISTLVVIFFVLIASILAFLPGFFVVGVFLILSRVIGSVRSSVSYPVSMELMDEQQKKHSELDQYAYICDNELFFNIGRILGVSIFAVIILYGSDALALRWFAFILGVIQLITLYPLKKMIQAIQN